MPRDLTDDESILVEVMMAWCHQATSHYLNQCGPRTMSAYGVTGPQWVKWWDLARFHDTSKVKISFIFQDFMILWKLKYHVFFQVSNKGLVLAAQYSNTPDKFQKSDFHSYIFPVLTCLVAYHNVLEKQRQVRSQILHIEAYATWPPFWKQLFQMHWKKNFVFDSNFIVVYSQGSLPWLLRPCQQWGLGVGGGCVSI